MQAFNGVKVFSATMKNDRERLGDDVTEWLRRHPGIEIIDKIVTQSSDSEFHCIAITLFYLQPVATDVADAIDSDRNFSRTKGPVPAHQNQKGR